MVIERHAQPSPFFAALHTALVESGVQVRMITVAARELLAPPGSDPQEPSGASPGLSVVPEPADVVLMDSSTSDMPGLLGAIRDCPRLAGVPVVALLEDPEDFSVEQYLSCGLTDFVFTSASIKEVIHRLRVIAARRAQNIGAEEVTDALRARVRSVSAALADNADTGDPRALAQILVRGLAHAFDADRVHLDLFDDEQADVLTEQWPAGLTGLPAPGVSGPEVEALAHHLWGASQVGIFNTPPRENPAHHTNGTNSDSPGLTGAIEAAGVLVDDPLDGQGGVPRSTIAVPLGDASHASGLVQLISDTGTLPWSEVHSALLQHVAGNFVKALRQVSLHARHSEAIERLAYLNFLKDDFVATINHEFRGPLATITGHLEMLADGFLGPIPENQHETLNILQRNTTRLNTLVENILTVSVLDHTRTAPAPMNLTDTVHTVVTGLRAAAATKDILLTTDLPAEPVIVTGHRGQLEEALRNVLRNSLDFTAPTGRIHLAVARVDSSTPELDSNPAVNQASEVAMFNPPDRVMLTIHDTGVGVPAVDLPHLYTSFYRGSNIKRSSTTGSGLGLTITKHILDRHEGTITIESQQEPTSAQGTTVRITLPLPAP